MMRLWLPALVLLFPLAASAQDTPTDGKSFWGWFPPNINPSYGGAVDYLYLVIMIVVLIAFFVTEGCLLYCCFAFRARPGHKAKYMHGSNKLETIWTVVPAILLLMLAFAQAGTWSDVKVKMPKQTDPGVYAVQVFGEQFKWHFRYPTDSEGKIVPGRFADHENNFLTNSRLHIPVGKKILVRMTARDVIHSLFIPHARVKQDAVPGMMTQAWFVVDRIPVWNLEKQSLELKNISEFDPIHVAVMTACDPSSSGWDFKDRLLGSSGQKEFWYQPTFFDFDGGSRDLRCRFALERALISQKTGSEEEFKKWLVEWFEKNARPVGRRIGERFRKDFSAALAGLPQEWETGVREIGESLPSQYRQAFDSAIAPQRSRVQALSNRSEMFHRNGAIHTGKTADAKYLMHYVEIACAELCGMGHTTMKGFLTVHTDATHKLWLDKELEYGVSKEELPIWKRWDQLFPEFNK
jgi:heme/copper-type cytochrome/quinol oxidase subunit 2